MLCMLITWIWQAYAHRNSMTTVMVSSSQNEEVCLSKMNYITSHTSRKPKLWIIQMQFWLFTPSREFVLVLISNLKCTLPFVIFCRNLKSQRRKFFSDVIIFAFLSSRILPGCNISLSLYHTSQPHCLAQ